MNLLKWLHSLFHSNSSRGSRGIDRTFTPQLEALESREVPAITSANVVVQGGVNALVIEADLGNDNITIVDYGNTGTGNLRVTANSGTAMQTRLNSLTQFRHITKLEITDAGGANTIAYTLRNPLGDRVSSNYWDREIHVTTNGPLIGPSLQDMTVVDPMGRESRVITPVPAPSQQNLFTVDVPGLQANARMLVAYDGSSGNDTVRAGVHGTLASGSELGFGLYGHRGSDSIGLDASRLNIAARATALRADGFLWANLSGNGWETFNEPDNGNDIQFWYSGDMDGRLHYNIMGSGGDDYLVALMDFDKGSTGDVGNPYAGDEGNPYANERGSHSMNGGAGNDTMYLSVRGNWSEYWRLFQDAGDLWVDGGLGDYDNLYYSLEALQVLDWQNIERRAEISSYDF